MKAVTKDIFADATADGTNSALLPPRAFFFGRKASTARNNEEAIPIVQVDIVHRTLEKREDRRLTARRVLKTQQRRETASRRGTAQKRSQRLSRDGLQGAERRLPPPRGTDKTFRDELAAFVIPAAVR
jgi:hypothetical protein